MGKGMGRGGKSKGSPVCFFGCCLLLSVIAGPAMLFAGREAMVENSELTQELCGVSNVRSESCTYECNCHTKDGKKKCSSCSGTQYEYGVRAELKCNNEIRSTGTCAGNPVQKYALNEEIACYVPDCERGVWYDDANAVYTRAVILFSFGSIFSCVFLCALAAFGFAYSRKQHKSKKKEYYKDRQHDMWEEAANKGDLETDPIHPVEAAYPMQPMQPVPVGMPVAQGQFVAPPPNPAIAAQWTAPPPYEAVPVAQQLPADAFPIKVSAVGAGVDVELWVSPQMTFGQVKGMCAATVPNAHACNLICNGNYLNDHTPIAELQLPAHSKLFLVPPA